MLTRHLKFFIRNLLRNKVYAFFSIISLAVGLACSILIYRYVASELSYDTFFKHSDRIARLEFVSTFQQGGPSYEYANLPKDDIPSGLSSIPEIVKKTRIAALSRLFVRSNHSNKVVVNNGFAADSSFFDLFNFKILEGNSRSPLSQPNCVVLTQKTARKFFGSEDPVGKPFFVYFGHNEVALKITAVIENVPANSHFDFNFLIDAVSLKKLSGYSLSDVYVAWDYLLLSKNANTETVTRKIDQLIPKNDAKYFHYVLMPLTKIHLYSNARYEIQSNGDIRTVYFFSFIAIVILLISSINFISLFLSYSAGRYKEIGVRKVLGANNYQLTEQLLFESVGIAVLSLPMAFILAGFCLPLFNSLTSRAFTLSELMSLNLILKALLFAVVTGLLSGVYPALILPGRAHGTLLNSLSAKNNRSSFFQNAIVVTQFAASAILIIGLLVVWHQLSFVRNKNLGFHKNGIIIASNYLVGKKLDTFKEMLSGNANIKNISASSYIPGTSETGGTGLIKSIEEGDSITCEWVSVDYNFFKTYGVKIARGRSFSKEYPTDSTRAFMINEAAVTALGLKNPIGKRLNTFNRTGKIIGVVKNFDYLSLHKEIPPMVFLIDPKVYFSLSIKLATTKNLQSTLSDIKKAWYSLRPNVPFEFSFLDQKFNALYKNDRDTGKTYFFFSVVAILISCLGLFSLASYSMQRRTKEIGIRKVLGATVPDILNLFYSRYLRLIIIANVLAIPVAWYFLNNWLSNFAFRIRMGVLPFIAAFVVTIILTLLTVSYWTLKTAYSNPVDSIRIE